MKNKYLVWVVLVAAVVGITMVVHDLGTKKRGELPGNVFAYPEGAYATVDSSEVGYKETRQITIKNGRPRAFAYSGGKIYLLIDSMLQVLTPKGERLFTLSLGDKPVCVAVSGTDILVGFEHSVRRYDASGNVLFRSPELPDSSLISSLAVWKDRVYVADAGEKKVRLLNGSLQESGSFKGESGVSDQHGFIIPSLHFDLAVNADGELWVVNPGMHALQNYAPDGVFRGQCSASSVETKGFSGCCNPFHIAFLSDGSFVTSEKGLVRVKVHKPSGELFTVVAPPDAFPDEYKAPDVAVDEHDNILLLDMEKRMIRFFSPK